MKTYEVVVIGAGDVGLGIVFKALSEGYKVALINRGPVGGTCVNVGCVPSKTLVYAADRIIEILEAGKLGIQADIRGIDFGAIMGWMRSAVTSGRTSLEKAIRTSENLDFYDEIGHFVEEYTLQVKEEKIRGDKIFIATGSRNFIPPIKGLETVGYLTNESVLDLTTRPESLLIIGGGFIAVEYAHFFSALGTKVAMIERNRSLIAGTEPEISALLQRKMGKRMEISTDTEVVEVRRVDGGCAVRMQNRETGEEREISAERIMVATGRRSNADWLMPERAGIEVEEKGFIRVDEYLRTNKENIWALGDAIGKAMFTHAGDKEAEIAWHNATHAEKIVMDFEMVPYAVFTQPQIASVGLTEEQARKTHEVLVGRASYSDTVMGTAMREDEGFAMAVVEKNTRRILGFHIIGPEAAILIQEVVNAVANNSTVESITGTMHIFPALSDLITETLSNLE